MEDLAQSCCWGAQPMVSHQRKSTIICCLKLGRRSLPFFQQGRAGHSASTGVLVVASQGKADKKAKS